MSGQRGGRNLLRGILGLARFRAGGMAGFGAAPRDFLNSLAPFIGFALVGTVLRVVSGDVANALVDLSVTIVAVTAPPVLSHALAAAWGREAAWVRYATAFNWCHWVILLGLVVMVVPVSAILTGAGMAQDTALLLAAMIWAGYSLSMHWFIARHGLGISRFRAVLVLLAVEIGVGLLVLGPVLLINHWFAPGRAG